MWLISISEFVELAMRLPWACRINCIAPFSFTLVSEINGEMFWQRWEKWKFSAFQLQVSVPQLTNWDVLRTWRLLPCEIKLEVLFGHFWKANLVTQNSNAINQRSATPPRHLYPSFICDGQQQWENDRNGRYKNSQRKWILKTLTTCYQPIYHRASFSQASLRGSFPLWVIKPHLFFIVLVSRLM